MHAQSLLSFSLLLTAVSAHFKLNYPTSIGFNEDKENEFPCGSFDITDRKTITQFPISGNPIAVLTTHPSVQWEFRAVLLNDTSNFKMITGTISQTGQGNFCEPDVSVPKEWEGKEGAIQVIQKSADAEGGFLYQCAAVNFTAAATKPDSAAQSACKNATNVKAEFVSQTFNLPSSTATGSAASASSTSKSNAAAPMMAAGANVFAAAILVACMLV